MTELIRDPKRKHAHFRVMLSPIPGTDPMIAFVEYLVKVENGVMSETDLCDVVVGLNPTPYSSNVPDHLMKRIRKDVSDVGDGIEVDVILSFEAKYLSRHVFSGGTIESYFADGEPNDR